VGRAGRRDVGLPMLPLSRHSRDAEGTPVEWVRSVYRGSRYKFVAALRRPMPGPAQG
jgi:GntR family transcriptional regulator